MLSLRSLEGFSCLIVKQGPFQKQEEGGAGGGWLAEGLSCLGRSPLQSTTRPAFSPTVLGPQRAVGGQSGWRPCAPPWPATHRTVRRGASRCAGGSPASAVVRLPAPLCPASGLPTPRNRGTDRGPSLGFCFSGGGGWGGPASGLWPEAGSSLGLTAHPCNPQSACVRGASCTPTAPRPARPAARQWAREASGAAGKSA